MPRAIVPSFVSPRYRRVGAIVGRLLAGYGELEFEMWRVVNAAENDIDATTRAIFSQRDDAARISRAQRRISDKCAQLGLTSTVLQIMGDMDWCWKIRNQYGHCHWYDTQNEGLCFVDLELLARQRKPISSTTDGRVATSLSLLAKQEAFFIYVRDCLRLLELDIRNKAVGAPTRDYPMPTKIERPPLHSGRLRSQSSK